MDELIDILPRWEQVPLRLRALYESYGYTKYRMGKFEPYDLYMENKEFLKTDGIITFTDASGRLMALKPDVTMSIVKNAEGKKGSIKYYYNENVFRIDRRAGEHREISQMGIEYIGADTPYAGAEVVGLALDTLRATSSEYALNIGHMGLIAGLLDGVDLAEKDMGAILHALKQKNQEELEKLATGLGIDSQCIMILKKLARLRGSIPEVLDELYDYVNSPGAKAALDELRELDVALKALGHEKGYYADFSVVNDMGYYNGLVFRGYVPQAARPVLAGGSYDNLMLRFGDPRPAIGFALYLTDLDRAFLTRREFDVDVMLICGNTSARRISQKVRELVSSGKSVRAEKEDVGEIRARETIYLSEKEEGAENA